MSGSSDVANSRASPITPEVLQHLRSWEGRTEVLHEEAALAPVRGLAATLNRVDLADVAAGGILPALWHWLYFLPRTPQAELGADGHPQLGGFLPPVPLPRRMWAGGRLRWHTGIRIGAALQRTTRVVSITHKAGRSGDLLFVLLRHEITCDGELAVSEEQDIVYRAAAQPGDVPPQPARAQRAPVWTRQVTPDPTLLFRYSALTFNAHRIHYDHIYATQAEGYQGLVVHGPLLATFLAEQARSECPDRSVVAFSFKGVRPTLDLHAFRICGVPAADGKSAQLWAEDHEGWMTMQGQIEFA